jgi:hypothetical protein
MRDGHTFTFERTDDKVAFRYSGGTHSIDHIREQVEKLIKATDWQFHKDNRALCCERCQAENESLRRACKLYERHLEATE